jgi:hypothetical protein
MAVRKDQYGQHYSGPTVEVDGSRTGGLAHTSHSMSGTGRAPIVQGGYYDARAKSMPLYTIASNEDGGAWLAMIAYLSCWRRNPKGTFRDTLTAIWVSLFLFYASLNLVASQPKTVDCGILGLLLPWNSGTNIVGWLRPGASAIADGVQDSALKEMGTKPATASTAKPTRATVKE